MSEFKEKIASIEAQLSSIRNGEHGSGIEIGRLLIRIEGTEYWRKEGSSGFTAWMSEHAQDFGVKDTMFWTNYRGALNYKNVIRPKSLSMGLMVPPLEDLSDNVSTENLDFLQKIMLAAPESVVRPLILRVIEGTITRAEIRELWHAYRGVVKPDPHRKGRIKTKDFSGVDSGKLFVTAALNALNRDRRWAAGEGDMDLFKLLREPSVSLPGTHSPDALLLIKRSGAPLEVHGLYIKTAINEKVKAPLKDLAPYVDRLWVILPQRCNHGGIPSFVGIVEIDDEDVRFVRPASIAEDLGDRVLELTRGLLVEAYK